MTRLTYPATRRNREPIARVLAEVLPARGVVLEVASGSGEHTAFFAPRFPDLVFQPSDVEAVALVSIDDWCADVPNVRPAIRLDATSSDWPPADAVFCANLVHISPWAATLGLLDGAARVLPLDGPLVLYGPYRVGGEHTAPSNAAFDASLRARDPAWGVRDLERVLEEATVRGLVHEGTVEMPANNLSVVFRRG